MKNKLINLINEMMIRHPWSEPIGSAEEFMGMSQEALLEAVVKIDPLTPRTDEQNLVLEKTIRYVFGRHGLTGNELTRTIQPKMNFILGDSINQAAFFTEFRKVIKDLHRD